MGICSICGSSSKETSPNRMGQCKECEEDAYVGWWYFMGKDTIKDVRQGAKSLKISIPELAWMVYESDTHLIENERKAIKDIFMRFKL